LARETPDARSSLPERDSDRSSIRSLTIKATEILSRAVSQNATTQGIHVTQIALNASEMFQQPLKRYAVSRGLASKLSAAIVQRRTADRRIEITNNGSSDNGR
jgi:hypothetical protein